MVVLSNISSDSITDHTYTDILCSAALLWPAHMDIETYGNHQSFNNSRVGWVNEPNGRGTMSILVSCIATLLLCSWSVMHLNIPRKGTSMVATFRSYAYWCFIGIFGPELVIWVAWRQFISAKALNDQLRRDNVR